MNVLWRRLVTPMQTRVSDQPAYLLHRRDWQNTSLILDLLTSDFGRVSVLAKGSKSSKSKSLYQPFTRLSVSWSGKQALKTLVGIEGVSLPVAESSYLPLLYINELVSAFLPHQESNGELYYLYESLLQKIELDDADLREFEKELMRILGFLPDISVEARTREAIDTDRSYQFIASEGFVKCGIDDNHAIDGASVIAWNEKHYESRAVLQMSKIVMRSVIDFNLQGKQLKSRDIYRQIKSYL
ncbi:MAG: DNA repair protein RecO (recombination protein O) [Gammaproteobacteria bacterium]|jgi:DNA repair protein RecO (recombination protein O)